jgi:hypothetical protein
LSSTKGVLPLCNEAAGDKGLAGVLLPITEPFDALKAPTPLTPLSAELSCNSAEEGEEAG